MSPLFFFFFFLSPHFSLLFLRLLPLHQPPQNQPPGIPKFYRWLSERYPLVNQPVLGTHVPEVDALYLDMNGIIHNCTHGNDPGSKLTEEQMILKIFQDLDKLFSIVQPQKLLFMAVDGEKEEGGRSVWVLFFYLLLGGRKREKEREESKEETKKKNSPFFFDSLFSSSLQTHNAGVAPRAKMNQQRSRRFKAAKERLEMEAEAREQAAKESLRGETLSAASSAASFDSNCITPGTPFMGERDFYLFFLSSCLSSLPSRFVFKREKEGESQESERRNTGKKAH